MSNIHQEMIFEASVEKVYSALTQTEPFSKFTGRAADISPAVGGEFSGFDGMVSGRHIELVPNQRVVQAWRVGPWPDGVYSLVRFELNATDSGGTQVVLDHAGYPEEAHEHLDRGWHQMYWKPLQTYFSQQ